MYKPDRWVVLKLPAGYKVLAGWSGGYLDGDSWRLNSGIKDVGVEAEHYLFYGYSGSIYRCHRDSYGFNSASLGMYNTIKEHADRTGVICEMMPEDTKWMEIDYEWRGSI